VFANVIRNAIEAVPQGGTITLHVFASQEWNGADGPRARVVIADTRSGICPENLFDPFFTTKGENGTGLGLWVSSGIILKHEGSIRAAAAHATITAELFLMSLPTEDTSH
jgi:signal transduction histidine kinase